MIKTKNKNIEMLWLFALLITPIVLWILPADYFDHGGFVICPSKRFFNIDCFGCGTTRAIMHFHHFDIGKAFFFHKASPLTYVLLVYLWYKWSRDSAKKLEII